LLKRVELVAELRPAGREELDEAALDGVVGGGITSYSSFSSRTLSAFRNFTAAPSIRTIGPDIGAVQEVEEEIQL
jgi:hypothetical protein